MIASYRVDLRISIGGNRFYCEGDEFYQYEIEAKVLQDYLNKRLAHFNNDDIQMKTFIVPVDPEYGV